jgi:hypothetical protein
LGVPHDGPTPRLEGMRPVTLHALGVPAVPDVAPAAALPREGAARWAGG